MLNPLTALLLASCVLSNCSSAASPKKTVETSPPKPLREMRGAWIATVANLDWPSKPGLSTADQKLELMALLDKAVELNLNVLIFQVRPACDALYASKLEPWSEFLTGQMGKAPEPFYDPLAFAVAEAHRRGLELHAWFNPFRVRAPNPKTGAATNHMTRIHPEFVRSYGSQLWLDPGVKAVTEHSTRVILDVVQRYDIDGVHLDDYFYPYPEKGATGQWLDFPDAIAWNRYRNAGGRLSQADWRRKNIDDFIAGLYRRVKAQKRWVKVGISPFGIWRPGFPKAVKGLDAYDRLYADAKKWMANGWLDYVAPQLYWSIDAPERSYPALLQWWAGQNPKSRLLCPGNDANKVGDPWHSAEIIQQVRLTRKQSGTSGNIFWNLSSLIRNHDGLANSLTRGPYIQPALVPAYTWLNQGIPGKPQIDFRPGIDSKPGKIFWNRTGEKPVWLWVCQIRRKGTWTTTLLSKDKTSWPVPSQSPLGAPEMIAITAVDRCGGASPTTTLRLNIKPDSLKPAAVTPPPTPTAASPTKNNAPDGGNKKAASKVL